MCSRNLVKNKTLAHWEFVGMLLLQIIKTYVNYICFQMRFMKYEKRLLVSTRLSVRKHRTPWIPT